MIHVLWRGHTICSGSRSKQLSYGFLLSEMVVVITIMGIISSIAYVGFATILPSARDSERDQDILTISDKLELYYRTKPATNGFTYPDTSQGITGLTTIVNSNDSLVAPGQTSTSLTLASTNATQTPTKDQYIYQPLTRTGDLCTNSAATLCASYILYYRREVSNNAIMINSQRQQ